MEQEFEFVAAFTVPECPVPDLTWSSLLLNPISGNVVMTTFDI